MACPATGMAMATVMAMACPATVMAMACPATVMAALVTATATIPGARPESSAARVTQVSAILGWPA